jgi:hypothetical protein
LKTGRSSRNRRKPNSGVTNTPHGKNNVEQNMDFKVNMPVMDHAFKLNHGISFKQQSEPKIPTIKRGRLQSDSGPFRQKRSEQENLKVPFQQQSQQEIPTIKRPRKVLQFEDDNIANEFPGKSPHQTDNISYMAMDLDENNKCQSS